PPPDPGGVASLLDHFTAAMWITPKASLTRMPMAPVWPLPDVVLLASSIDPGVPWVGPRVTALADPARDVDESNSEHYVRY
ncbi:MAG: hypothetical protein KC731_39630, partial [Myxococcales bacterium]|nr:hypothetical protein [Myxococcales bacterium]